MATSVFISYKWQDSERNAWVEKLYIDLRENGIDAKLDKYEVAPGESFSDYMTKNIRICNHVLFIVTREAVNAVEAGSGALAFEMQISNARRISEKRGFSIIPILREGESTSTYLSDNRYIDFRIDNEYGEHLSTLIGWLNGEIAPHPLGGTVKGTYYYGPENQESIEITLKWKRKFRITGYPSDVDPEDGQIGYIQLDKDDVLKYIRKSDDAHWENWYKNYYSWGLEWDNAIGVICTDRFAHSPK